MSNKSGVASQVISLPSGGGALQGIGETFSPDLFTGTGNFTVPLAVPPGRNGFHPKLDLVYSTGNGNGAFGLGWALSIPQVARKTSQGIPRYRDDSTNPHERDTFLLSGTEDLVPIGQSSAEITRFRPRTEGLFARIEHVRKAGDFWRVRSKDGLVSLYGAAPGSEAADPAVVADPERTRKIFSWMLAETTDPFSNRIEYEYLRDRRSEGPHVWDQLYLQTVRYVDYEQNGRSRFLVSVTFVYEDRPDPFSDYRAGFEVRTRLRCRRIEVRTHPADDEFLVRTYELVYLDERVRAGELDPAILPRNGLSLLSQIRVVGHDGARTEQLPPLEFGYSTFDPERRHVRPVEGTNNSLPRRSLADDDFELVDLFGHGLPDIVQLNGTAQFWRNLGHGIFDIPRRMEEIPVGVHLRDPGTQFGDMNGDGRADLLVLDKGGYYPLSFAGRWNPQGFVRYRMSPSVPFGDGNLRLVDLDGDGVVDALRTGSSFELFFNDPVNGWNAVETRPRGPIRDFPDVSFADPRVKLADLSGDGLQDIVLVEQGQIRYWPYLGHGRWGRRITMEDSPIFRDPVLPPGTFDPRRVLIGDVDGDGLDDIVYIEPNRATMWINRSGNGWSQPITVQGTPRFTDVDAVRLVDLLGTGTAGILWTNDSSAPAASSYQFADLTGGVKPYLLEEMNNHRGARTRVHYSSSIESYLADAADPKSRWKTPLPFPVQVVAAVEVIDEISQGKLTTEFRYHHGYWDGAEREFRGFGQVEQLDTERFERFNTPGLHGEGTPFDRIDQTRFSPPVLTKTWFHLGPTGDEFNERGEADFTAEYWPGDPALLERPAATRRLLRSLPAPHRADALRSLRGHVLRTELCTLDGSAREDRPFTVTESQYAIREENPPAGNDNRRLRIFFPHAVAQRSTQWERGADPMHQFTFTDAYDPYGLPGRQVSLAVARGRDFRVAVASGEPYLGTRTMTSYAQRDDEHRYIVDRVAATTTHEIINDGRPGLLALLDVVQEGNARLTVIGQTLHYYDGNPFTGLPLGQIGDFGALVRSETLVLTDEILRAAYRSGDPAGNQRERPPYLVPDGSPAWTQEYPQPFRDHLLPLAGYVFSPGDPDRARGYFVATSRQRYDFHDPARQGRGLLTATRDPLGRDTTFTYDRFDLLPVKVVDSVGLSTRAVHDYRVFQPSLITDPNGNRTAISFTPLGLLERTAVMGKDGEPLGDTLTMPGARLVYDFLAFANSSPQRRRPVSVRTICRVHHINDTDVPPPKRDETIETLEYSDGFDRLIQTRTQAEDTIFGDPTFGGNVLPAAQGDPATQEKVTARRNSNPQQPNVVVSGWQTYDNKGRVVEKYEPFLAAGWQYAAPADVEFGQRVIMSYDPRGQLVRTINPDDSEQRVIYGVPLDLADPERFTPTPWEAYTYDANDNAGRTHPSESGVYENHWNTPASVVLDALGQTVISTERHRAPRATPSDRLPPLEEFYTGSTYDIRGNLLGVTDALDRLAFQYVYDLADRPLRVQNIDAGGRRTILDAAGNEIERRDSKGALILQAYDVLSRPIRLWARDDGASSVTLRERLEYGDGSGPNQPASDRAANRAANRLGALHQHYDEAELLTLARYDFKGNVLDKARQVVGDAAIVAVFPTSGDPAPDWRVTPFRIDWQPPDGTTLEAHVGELLDPTSYQSSATYDALNRTTSMRYPRDVNGKRKELRPSYNRAGALEQVSLDGQIVVERIAYNAKGQRTLIALGNGILTRYAYHPQTFHLTRLRSERYTKPAPNVFSYQPTGVPLQDLAYRHDLTGNILEIIERTPGCGVQANPEAALITDPELRALVAEGNALARRFAYDPLYRLMSATGRECMSGAKPQPWADGPRCGFNSPGHGTPNQGNAPNLTSVYGETYSYDPVGNMTRLRHTTAGGSSARQFSLVPGTNRLRTLTAGATEFAYTHDPNGNMTSETTSRHFEWDQDNQLKAFRIQASTSEPSVHTHYLYDTAGQRVKKLTRKQGGGLAVTTYIDGIFEHHRWQGNGSPAGENNHLHVMDDQQRTALVRVGPPHPDDRGPAAQYHLSDHLGTSNLIANEDGSFVNREEHTPYGETSFGGFARKRYRYTGKERDEESGLSYHGARYYAPGLVRWVSPDPAGLSGGINEYIYATSNPMYFSDSSGLQSKCYEDFDGVASDARAGGDGSVPESDDQKSDKQRFQELREARYGGFDEERFKANYWRYVREREQRDNTVIITAEGRVGTTADLAKEANRAHAQESLDALRANIASAFTFWKTGDPNRAAISGELFDIAGAFAGTSRLAPSPGAARGAKAGSDPAALRGEPDVYAISLVRWKRQGEVNAADRRRARQIADRLGHTGPVDVGHARGHERVFTPEGSEVMLMAEPRGPNRSHGAKLKPEVERARSNPTLGIFTRSKRRR